MNGEGILRHMLLWAFLLELAPCRPGLIAKPYNSLGPNTVQRGILSGKCCTLSNYALQEDRCQDEGNPPAGCSQAENL